MEETITQDKPGFASRFLNFWARTDETEEVEEVTPEKQANGGLQLRANYRYTVTVRRQITSFDDAMAAANGLKRGETQILNLSGTDAATGQKIVDFMSGVNYAEEGTWQEVGDGVYLIVPANGYVEEAPPTPRMNALRN